MTCAEVRECLTEHSLGLLPSAQAGDVDRHLHWCAGCRKESAELLEGVASLALSLPPADPPLSLDDRVVDRVTASAGKRRRRGHRAGARMLAVAALAATLVAGGALQWGITQRKQAETLNSRVQRELEKELKTKRDLSALLAQLQDTFKGTGTLYQASLFPVARHEEGGTALVFSTPAGSGWILVDVVASLDEGHGPFSVNLVSSTGRRLAVGTLPRSRDIDSVHYVRYWPALPSDFTRPDPVEMSQVSSLEVIDRFGRPVVTGTVHQYVEPVPSP